MSSNADAPPARPKTIRDVAEAAGVTVSTVSHVFSGKRATSCAVKARVHAAVEALGYVPHPLAQQLVAIGRDQDPATAPVSIRQVARAAGVSVSTVSHAQSGKRPVSAETRAKVLDAIEQLGYVPNPLAQQLGTMPRRERPLAPLEPTTWE